MTDADTLLFTDKHGQPADLGDVVADGLEGGYEDRIPGLIRLLGHGTPAERLYAAVALISWGRPEGFEELSFWTSEPEHVPWAGAPVAFARVSGEDGAWEMLADALHNTHWLENREGIRSLRAKGARDLLQLADRVDYDRTLTVALAADRDVLADVAPDLRAAVERCLDRLAADGRQRFDLGTQTAGLLAALAKIDDDAAADYAGRLVGLAPGNRRMLRELVDAMANGTGEATLARLHELRASGDPVVQGEAERALGVRGAG